MLDFFLGALAQAIFYGIGYVTAWIAVPALTLGLVRVEPAQGGRRIISAEMAPLVGWGLIIAGIALAAFVRFKLLADP